MYQKIGHYHLMTKLAEKYSHSTYLASPINEPERQVVLTLFASSLCHSPQERESLLIKAARIQQFQHKHIVTTLDIGIKEQQLFIVHEHLLHGSLRNLLKNLSPQGLELDNALNIILQVGDALMYAHNLQIFHSNLKPENVLLDATGRAVVTDFNLLNNYDVLIRDHMTDKYPLCYMAPEQFSGTGDAKSDQYMLGCLTYELITGRPPFVAQNIDLMHSQHSNAKPTSFFEGYAHLPASLEAAVLKTLEKDPDRRFTNLSQFLESIRSIVSPPTVSAETHFTNFKSKRVYSHFMLSRNKETSSPTAIKYTAFPSFDSQKQEASLLMKSTTADTEKEQYESCVPETSEYQQWMPTSEPITEIEEEQYTSFMTKVSIPENQKPMPLIKKPIIEMEEVQHTSFLPQIHAKKSMSLLIKKPTLEVREMYAVSSMPEVSTTEQDDSLPLIQESPDEKEKEKYTSFAPEASAYQQKKSPALVNSYPLILPFLQWMQKRLAFQLSHRPLRKEQAYTLAHSEMEPFTAEKFQTSRNTTYRLFAYYFSRMLIGSVLLLSVVISIIAYAFWQPGQSVSDPQLYTTSSTSDNPLPNSTPTLLANSIPNLRTNPTPSLANSAAPSTKSRSASSVATVPNTANNRLFPSVASSSASTKTSSAPSVASPSSSLASSVASSSASTKTSSAPSVANSSASTKTSSAPSVASTPSSSAPTTTSSPPSVTYSPTATQTSSTPTTTNSPAITNSSQTTTIDDSIQGTSSNQFHYIGGWQHITNLCQGNPCEYNNGNSWDNTVNDYVMITFTGVQLRFYGVVDPKHGIGAVSIDGGSETMIDFYAANRAGNQLLWTSPSLPAGTHTFKLRVTGNKNPKSSNTYAIVDRVDTLS